MEVLPTVQSNLNKSAEAYRSADPFPHIVIDNFLPESLLDTVIECFPRPEADIWTERIKEAYQVKLASNNVDGAPPPIRDLMYQLNSATVLKSLEKLTGEGPLISDPFFDGGGLHQIERGGHLAIHSDFAKPRHLAIFRRLNLIIYLNKNWKEEFGGSLELWSRDGKEKVKSVLPIANRAVIFTTDTTSFHGHPEPINCPPDMSRRSLALYYYSVQPPARAHNGTTTRWRLNIGNQEADTRIKVASFLWRASGKIGNIASRMETKNQEATDQETKKPLH
jgi:2OG-Fe(II) oxygenase superfamily